MPEFNLTTFLANAPTAPGVYRMFDQSSNIIYVGKAKNLKKRLSSYFSGKAKDNKTIRLVRQIAYIEVTVADSDYEAFLLESNLIKKHRPKYNILFKDDKAYPYIVVTNQKFPKVYGYRGKKNKRDYYFGPYVSLSSVKNTLALLQKIFQVRQCKDSFFQARTRPCLQYQINRCTAPCVGYIKEEDYAVEVKQLTDFLNGHLNEVLTEVAKKMQQASQDYAFELAAKYRDQLTMLQKLQEQQYTDTQSEKNYEVIGVCEGVKSIGLSLLQVAHGKILGEKSWLVKTNNKLDSPKKAVEQLFTEHYLFSDRTLWPDTIIINADYLPDSDLLSIIGQHAKRTIEWITHPRGIRYRWLKLAQKNALNKITMNESFDEKYTHQLQSLKALVHIDTLNRFECFDVSHAHGEQTVASCVVFDTKGPAKSEYRKYNIKDITASDDYAAMDQVLDRRISSGIEKDNLPELMIIDGGKGQFNTAKQVLARHGLLDTIQLCSLGKGQERKSGSEDVFIYPNTEAIQLDPSHPGFLLMREIRDEAHRFSITAQRKKTQKVQNTSLIERIPGIGQKRADALLLHFGGWQALEKASVDEITKVQGIGKQYADKIWHALH